MIKLSAHVSKKVPQPDIEYSSQSYSAGLEIELASGTKAADIKKKLREVYALLEHAVDDQLASQRETPNSSRPLPSETRKALKERNNSSNRMATQAQIKAIDAIAHDRAATEQELKDLIREFGVASLSALSIRQASALIDKLKKGRDS